MFRVRTEADRQTLIGRLQKKTLPFIAEIRDGDTRSQKQNRLQHQWYRELEAQGDMTAEEYRAYTKLTIGVPILRQESPFFRERYDQVVKPMDYRTKLNLMVEPFDFPVTRLMTTDQHRRFLDEIYRRMSQQGFVLTDPDWSGMEVA